MVKRVKKDHPGKTTRQKKPNPKTCPLLVEPLFYHPGTRQVGLAAEARFLSDVLLLGPEVYISGEHGDDAGHLLHVLSNVLVRA